MKKLISCLLFFIIATSYAICSYLDPKIIPVPSKDSVANSYIQDVIGNKTDESTGNSIYAHIDTIEEHMHGKSLVYPSMNVGIIVTKNNTAWVLGGYTVIIPSDTVSAPYDVHSINFDSISANGTYEIVLYSAIGGVWQEVGRTRFTRTSTQDIANDSTFIMPLVDTNASLQARLAGSATGTDNVVISVRYHKY